MIAMEKPPLKEFSHAPVLFQEVIAQFNFPGQACVVDGTLGYGGHAQGLLERYPRLSPIGGEWDREALEAARHRLQPFGPRFRAVEGNYADLPQILQREGIPNASGIFLDLGVSSPQLDDPARGFSFMRRGPLDMRMSQSQSETAWDVLHRSDETELARLFKTYGEEPCAFAVAKTLKTAIERGRLPNDTLVVAQCIRAALPAGRGRIDPATRCFQALRMAVNHELDNLKSFLDAMPSVLAPGGRVVILAFHSLEDRMVKRAFTQAVKGCVCPPQAPQCVCGKKPWARLPSRKAVQASEAERLANPRARSVRMRVLEKI